MHLAHDLAKCTTVLEILKVLGEHQSSTGRVAKLKQENAEIRAQLAAALQENATWKRKLRAAK